MKKKLGSIALIIVAVVAFVIILPACGPSVLGGASGPSSSRVSFDNRPVDSSRNMTLSRASTPSQIDESLQVITDLYSELGNKVGSYTPSEFKLYIWDIVLYQQNVPAAYIYLDYPLSYETAEKPSFHQANFLSDIDIVAPSDMLPGHYDGLWFSIRGERKGYSNGTISDGPSVKFLNESTITVNVPGYENIWSGTTIDLSGVELGIHDTLVNNDDGSITFGLDQLQPSYISGNYEDISLDFHPKIENIFYMENIDYHAVLPGEPGNPEYLDSKIHAKYVGYSGNAVFTSDGDGAIFIPFNGVTIPESSYDITFSIVWDLEGIIEVYDNSTPTNKTDDIMVLADRFWERISLETTVIHL